MQHIQTRLDHDNDFVAGAPALDFANTVGGSRERPTHDHIARYADVVGFARQAELITAAQATRLLSLAKADSVVAAEVLERALRLRDAIWAAFPADRDAPTEALKVISDEAARAASHMSLSGDGRSFSWQWRDEEDLGRVVWPIARSAAELLTSNELRAAVRECESESCSWLFLDKTRNHSRRWCDMGDCGNRAKARRFRERRAAYRVSPKSRPAQ